MSLQPLSWLSRQLPHRPCCCRTLATTSTLGVRRITKISSSTSLSPIVPIAQHWPETWMRALDNSLPARLPGVGTRLGLRLYQHYMYCVPIQQQFSAGSRRATSRYACEQVTNAFRTRIYGQTRLVNSLSLSLSSDYDFVQVSTSSESMLLALSLANGFYVPSRTSVQIRASARPV
ncbi:hypothetical protein CH063_09819 [Colletotrichum higginsianum]|uniref:Uncharacterized protein n=1 Tax=Colletotrichum higginsianum (strain IMI 349063) TaxID=759273 RepID=H1VF26_COLHI|nr:hypothetical protein CH063_09819 [Colletotrichum higginsianum]